MPIEPVDLAEGADPGGEVPDLLRLPAVDKPTAHDLRQARLYRVFALGYHPVGNPHGLSLRLHPAAPPADDRAAPGPRCGDCAHWRIPPKVRRARKCTRPPHAYRPAGHPARGGSGTSRGRGADVPEWFPACADHTPAPDAPGPDDAG